MKYIITENQLDRFISKWLSKEYMGLKIYDHGNKPWTLYVDKDGEIIFLYQSIDNELYVSRDVMKFLSNMFSIDDVQVKTILEDWFQEQNELMVVKVIPWNFDEDWNKIFRWETKRRLP
jgi:hypothetical protein